MSDAAVAKATGKDWAAWTRLLDRAGARQMKHREIAGYLHTKHELPGWWAQMVTVGYERLRGLRRMNETPGGFEISKARTIHASAARAFAAWKSAAQRKAWLDHGPLTVRTATANKSLRLNWVDGKTVLAVNFYPKERSKCQVVVQHMKLPGTQAAERMKKYWGAALENLSAYLEAP